MEAKLAKNFKLRSGDKEYSLKKGLPLHISKSDDEKNVHFGETLTKEGIISGWFPFDVVIIEADQTVPKSRKARSSTKYKAEKEMLNSKIAARPAKETLVEKGILQKDQPDSIGKGKDARPTISKMLSKSFAFTSTPPKKENETSAQKKIFGSALGQVMYTSYTEYKIPPFILKAVSVIEEKGLNEEGVFRVSGSTLETNDMKDKIDREEDPEWSKYDVQSVSSLLKLFFRSLPDPLLTYDLYDGFAKSLESKDRLNKVKDLVNQLPEVNRVLLGKLLSLLKKVSERADQNKMSASNLGIVFGPTLMWQKNPDSTDIRSNLVGQDVVTFMIENYSTLFPKFDDKKEVYTVEGHKRTPSTAASPPSGRLAAPAPVPQKQSSFGQLPGIEPPSPVIPRANPPPNSAPLPSGWEEKLDPKGRVYYVDRIGRKTQWEDPRITLSKNA